jgi:serine/threonine protein kinase
MKACPSCGRLYPPDAGFCPVDGTALTRASRVPVLPADDARVGQALAARYQVRRVIADGGMGRVYEALDLAENRSVAVKVLHPNVASDPVQIERFEREFAISRQLSHQRVVEVLDFVAIGSGERALVMELLYGEELKNTLSRENAMGPARVLRMVSQVAQALDEAHRRGIVHRDLKPDNLYLCQTATGDNVKVLDFGSIKDTARGSRQLTALGTTIGSPSYMSPEQAQASARLDHRADVWSLAAITFEALSGQLPFTAALPAQILLAIVSRRPKVASVLARAAGRELPRTVDRVLERAFRKAPAERYDSVGAFADALGRAFGLSGGHDDWAEWPERKLTAEIALHLPDLLAADSQAAPSPEDDFFDQADALAGRPASPPPLSLPPNHTEGSASAEVEPAFVAADVAAELAAAAPPRRVSIPSKSLPFWPTAPAGDAPARDRGKGQGPGLGRVLLLGVPLLLLLVLFLVFR